MDTHVHSYNKRLRVISNYHNEVVTYVFSASAVLNQNHTDIKIEIQREKVWLLFSPAQSWQAWQRLIAFLVFKQITPFIFNLFWLYPYRFVPRHLWIWHMVLFQNVTHFLPFPQFHIESSKKKCYLNAVCLKSEEDSSCPPSTRKCRAQHRLKPHTHTHTHTAGVFGPLLGAEQGTLFAWEFEKNETSRVNTNRVLLNCLSRSQNLYKTDGGTLSRAAAIIYRGQFIFLCMVLIWKTWSFCCKKRKKERKNSRFSFNFPISG